MARKYPTVNEISRRELLKRFAGAAACVPLARLDALYALLLPGVQSSQALNLPPPSRLTHSDDQFLETLEKANFRYFWEQTNPKTGLTKDRFNVRTPTPDLVGSIAATGFGLTALCIGVKRRFVSRTLAQQRALASLRFMWDKLPQHRGFYYHWANVETGERTWDSEVSSIDTSILLCGVLTCKAFFEHTEISDLAARIFDRVDWNWLSEDTDVLPHGWTPETGFLPYRWDNYSEMMMMYLLGLGSPTHTLPAAAWNGWKRTTFEFDGIDYIGSYAPLFVHQYSQAWFDFRHKRDRYADYFENSVIATDVHRRFCLDLSKEFPDYSNDLWGITASDSDKGYQVWGGPPKTGPIDGTVAPAAAAGSLPFLPGPAMLVLRNIKANYGAKAWCKYGFVDAFNPLTKWYDTDVVGIDTGITMVMSENARTGFVWDTFMKNPEARRGMERAGFHSYKPSSKQEMEQSDLPLSSPSGTSSEQAAAIFHRNSIKARP